MHRTILGIEGTAWNLSAGVVTETDVLAEGTATYQPKIGGIHPREAAQHHADQIASVFLQLLLDIPLIGGNHCIAHLEVRQ